MVLLVILNLYFCFELPLLLSYDSGMYMFAHESVKFWVAILSLGSFGSWACSPSNG